MSRGPIFIVGVPRSGTTLLAAMLSAHSRMSCGPETHFFPWLSRVDGEQLWEKDLWPDTATEFLTAITFSTYSGSQRIQLIEKYELEEKDIFRFLEKKEPEIANLLGALTEPYMERMGKSRWIEKTPDHLEYVGQIRQHFPDSPIIRILRDPRDVALSLTKTPWGTSNLVDALLYWHKLDDISAQFFETDRLSYTLRFEDLIVSPREELSKICQFLGESFEERMLDTSRTGKQINTSSVPWKDKASKSVDSSRLAVWRREMNKQENGMVEAILGDRLDLYDYPRVGEYKNLGEIYPSQQTAAKYPEAFKSKLPSGVRFWKEGISETPSVKIFIGDPDNDNWLGRSRFERLKNTVTISAGIIKFYISSKPVYWIQGQSEHKPGKRDSLLKSFLRNFMLSSEV